MVDAFIVLFFEAVFSFLPVLGIGCFLKWTGLLRHRQYSVLLIAFAIGVMCYFFSYLFTFKVFSAILENFDLDGSLPGMVAMGGGGALHYLMQGAVIRAFFRSPIRDGKAFPENLPVYLFALALGGYSLVFLNDVGYLVKSLGNLADFVVNRSDPFGAMREIEHTTLDSLLLSVASCLRLVFLTLTVFSISEELGEAGKRRYLGVALFSAMAATDIGLVLHSLEEFSVVSLALGNLLMLHYYRHLQAAGSARRP
jgi:hypothetical protein